MYGWLLFLHMGTVLLFMLAHGVHVTIMWAWRNEADPERGLTLFNGLPNPGLTRVLGLAVIATGLLMGYAGDWLGQWWMWASLVILVAMWAGMYRWGGGYFGLIEAAAEAAVAERQGGSGATTAVEAYQWVRAGWQPPAMMVLGIVGLAIILWLMIFKPF